MKLKVASVELCPLAVDTDRQTDRRGTTALVQPLGSTISAGVSPVGSLPCCTHTKPPHININTHHWSPPERSISRDHTASPGSQALLTCSTDVDGP